jgi:predicted N-acyltransferase
MLNSGASSDFEKHQFGISKKGYNIFGAHLILVQQKNRQRIEKEWKAMVLKSLLQLNAC